MPTPEVPHWLAGRTAIVTGASRGIGRATAIALAGTAAHVVIVGRDAEALEQTCDLIHHGGGQAKSVIADVSRGDDVDRIFRAAEMLGPPTALVCAAAVLQRVPFAETSLATWQDTLAVNLTGTFLCCRAAFAAMQADGGGRIVNIASLSGVYGTEKFPGLSAYNVSKYGVIGLTEAIAVEGKPHGITAVCVSPGAVDTRMLRQANPDLRPGLQPEHVADLIVALLDNPMAPASGANIPLFSNA